MPQIAAPAKSGRSLIQTPALPAQRASLNRLGQRVDQRVGRVENPRAALVAQCMTIKGLNRRHSGLPMSRQPLTARVGVTQI